MRKQESGDSHVLICERGYSGLLPLHRTIDAAAILANDVAPPLSDVVLNELGIAGSSGPSGSAEVWEEHQHRDKKCTDPRDEAIKIRTDIQKQQALMAPKVNRARSCNKLAKYRGQSSKPLKKGSDGRYKAQE